MPPGKTPPQETPLNVDVPTPLWYELDELCEATRLKKKKVVELALRRILAELRGKKDEKSP